MIDKLKLRLHQFLWSFFHLCCS